MAISPLTTTFLLSFILISTVTSTAIKSRETVASDTVHLSSATAAKHPGNHQYAQFNINNTERSRGHGRRRGNRRPNNVCNKRRTCPPGQICTGRPAGRCVTPIPLNGPCSRGPSSVCGAGLRCMDRRCVRVVGLDESCKEAGTVCEDGLVCVGNARRDICVKPMGVGQGCGRDPFWICRSDLVCVNHKCARR